jgi:hypothetical protein
MRIIFWDYAFEQFGQNLNPFLGMSEQGLATSAINLTHVLLLILESSGFLDLAIDYVVLFGDCLRNPDLIKACWLVFIAHDVHYPLG